MQMNGSIIPGRYRAQKWFEERILLKKVALHKVEFSLLEGKSDGYLGLAEFVCKKRLGILFALLSPVWVWFFFELNEDSTPIWFVLPTCIICILLYGLPILTIIAHKPKIYVRAGLTRNEAESVIVHELTHVVRNNTRLKFFLHTFMTNVTSILPFRYKELEEGLAVWVEEQYALDHNQQFYLGNYPDWYQNGFQMVKKMEKRWGRRFVLLAINYL